MPKLSILEHISSILSKKPCMKLLTEYMSPIATVNLMLVRDSAKNLSIQREMRKSCGTFYTFRSLTLSFRARRRAPVIQLFIA